MLPRLQKGRDELCQDAGNLNHNRRGIYCRRKIGTVEELEYIKVDNIHFTHLVE